MVCSSDTFILKDFRSSGVSKLANFLLANFTKLSSYLQNNNKEEVFAFAYIFFNLVPLKWGLTKWQ